MSLYKNTMWSFISIIGVQFINILTNIVLARILSPEYFGVLGMAIVFAGVAFVIQEVGVNSYLIYIEKTSTKTINSTFWLNVILSALVAVSLLILSPFISNFFNNQSVSTIINFICIGIVVGSFGSTQRALCMKEGGFSKLSKIDIVAEILSSVIAIILALYISGLLAVSAKYVVRPLVQTILIVRVQPIKIFFSICKTEIKSIFGYSINVLGSQLFMYGNNNIDFLLVGHLLGDRLLGMYTMAFQWGALARYYLSGAIIRVIFPEAAKQKNDIKLLGVTYKTVISQLAFLTFPICLGLALISHEFITIVYTSKWIEAAPVLQILLISGGFASVSVIGGPVLRGIGKQKVEMYLSLLSFVLFTLLIYTNIEKGIIGVAYAELIRMLIIEGLRTVMLSKYLEIKIISIINSVLPALICTFLMALSVELADMLLNKQLNIYFIISLKILLGVITYIMSSAIINKKSWIWMNSLVKKIVRK